MKKIINGLKEITLFLVYLTAFIFIPYLFGRYVIRKIPFLQTTYKEDIGLVWGSGLLGLILCFLVASVYFVIRFSKWSDKNS